MMNPGEYEVMAELEAEHWWYRALRQHIADCLQRFGHRLPPAPLILDAGCGTGENLRFLCERLQPTYAAGFDTATAAIAWARRKVPQADLYVSDICQPQLHRTHYDLVLSCDVLYITGLEQAQAGMQRIAAALRPEGLLLLNLPAYQWLRSDHDLAIGTRERFVASQVRQFITGLGLEPVWVTYRLCPLFPLVVASRLPSILWPNRCAATARSALRPPSRWESGCMGVIMNWENCWLRSGWPLPWGSSVFAVGRKP